MSRTTVIVVIALLLGGCGESSSREADVHYTMDYADGGQTPVPPQAISPFEPQDITYVDEPLIELDSDWNMDVKLFSKYRYTNEFVRRWREKYGYTPTLPVMDAPAFFDAIDLDAAGLGDVKAATGADDFAAAWAGYLSYRAEKAKSNSMELPRISKEDGEVAVGDAREWMADPDFPACRPGMRFSLWGIMWCLERAYLYTKDVTYARAWLEMFEHWYVTYRPPAQRPKMYISFVWMPYWRTLGASGSAKHLCRCEPWLVEVADELDQGALHDVYKSILEHARYLMLCNDVFMPSNWQTGQSESLIRIGTEFPAFDRARLWREHGWELTQEHMEKETYDDGTHCENSVGYATGVIHQYLATLHLVRDVGLDVPEEFLRKLKSMYLWAVKIVPPTGNYVPCGDNGLGADGSFVKRAIVDGALEFADPTMKFFAMRYPDDVRKAAEEGFANAKAVLEAYDAVQAEEPAFTSILLPDTGWAVMRTSWDVRSPYLFFDYGWDEAWHSHPDFGSFDVWAYGSPLVTECGRGGSYEADVSKRWYKQTIAHNTVMVDHRSQRKCADNHLNRWWTGSGYDFAGATGEGYRWIGVLHNRRVLFVKPDYWIITDFLPGPSFYGTSFQTSGYHEFDWLAHFQPTELRIDREAKRIDTTNEDANVALVALNGDEVEIQQHEGPMSSREGVVGAPYISLHREGLAFVQYQVLVLPYEGATAPAIDVRRLDADPMDRVHRQNVGYELGVQGRKDVLLESGNPGEKVAFGTYEFRGTLAHIRDVGRPGACFLLVDSDHLAHDGKVVFSAPGVLETIEFAVEPVGGGGGMLLRMTSASDVSGAKFLAPGVTKVEVGGEERRFRTEGDYVIVE